MNVRRADLPLWIAAAAFVGACAMALLFAFAPRTETVRGAAEASTYVIHLQPGEQVTVIADGPGPTAAPTPTPPTPAPTASQTSAPPSASARAVCQWTGNPVNSGGPFPSYSGLSIAAVGLTPGASYQAWAYGYASNGDKGYATSETAIAAADGQAAFPFASGVRADVTHWEGYVYSLPGSPSTTTVTECGWFAPASAPTCSVLIEGFDVWVNASGLMAGESYAVWWHVDLADGTTYDASGNALPARPDGTWRFVYDLTPGHTEVYVYQPIIVDGRDTTYGDPSAAVAECEYDA